MPFNMVNKIKDGVVLISGGMDSTTLLYHIKNEYPDANIHAMTMYYGQRHKNEVKFAKMHCKKLNVPLYEMKLDFIGKMTENVSSLIKDSN